jgi:hypothetical protein
MILVTRRCRNPLHASCLVSCSMLICDDGAGGGLKLSSLVSTLSPSRLLYGEPQPSSLVRSSSRLVRRTDVRLRIKRPASYSILCGRAIVFVVAIPVLCFLWPQDRHVRMVALPEATPTRSSVHAPWITGSRLWPSSGTS